MNRVAPKTRDAWLRRVTSALQLAVPQFSALEVKVDSAGRPHLESRYTNWRTSGARQDEIDLSDGTLRLIGLLWSLVEVGRKGAPVLLEEPELSLHPAVIRMLPNVLARAQRTNGAQIMLTTHSPELLTDEGIRADEVLVLTPTADGTEGLILSATRTRPCSPACSMSESVRVDHSSTSGVRPVTPRTNSVTTVGVVGSSGCSRTSRTPSSGSTPCSRRWAIRACRGRTM